MTNHHADEHDDPDATTWRHGLQSEAAALQLPGGDPSRIPGRARRRRRRVQAGLGAVTALAVVSGGLVWQNRHDDAEARRQTKLIVSDDATPTVVASATTLPTKGQSADLSTMPDITFGASGLTWSKASAPFGQGLSADYFGGGIRANGGQLVAISTAPGTAADTTDGAGVIYTSTDAVHWKGQARDSSHWFGDLTTSRGTLYAVGTAAATAKIDPQGGVGDLVFTSSTDSGKTWHDVVLPLDMRGALTRIHAAGGLFADARIGIGQAAIAQGAGGTLVVVQLQATMILRALLPASVDLSWGMVTTALGVDVLAAPTDPAATSCANGPITRACQAAMDQQRGAHKVAHSYGWAELGVPADLVPYLGFHNLVYHSTDNVHFTEVAAPVELTTPSPIGGRVALTATASGFAVALGSGDARSGSTDSTHVWATDGTSWAAKPVLPLALTGWGGGSAQLGEVGGHLMLAGSVGDSPAVAVESAAGWTVTPLARGFASLAGPEANAYARQSLVGPSGFATGVVVAPDLLAQAHLRLWSGGFTLKVVAGGAIDLVEDATGAVVFHTADWSTPSSTDTVEISGGSTSDTADCGSGCSVPTTTIVGAAGAGGVVAPAIAPSGTIPGVVVGQGSMSCSLSGCTRGGSYGMPTTLTVLDPATKQVRATFSLTDLHSLVDKAARTDQATMAKAYVVRSVDGTTWTADDLATLAGQPVHAIANLAVTADTLVVTAVLNHIDPAAPHGPNDPPVYEQIVLQAKTA